MPNEFVLAAIRRSNRNAFFIAIGGMLIVVIGLAVSARYLFNMFLGPSALPSRDLLTVQEAGDLWRYYVTVKGDDHANTGFEYVNRSSSGSETTEAYYHALFVGDRFLLVKSPTDEIENTVTGELLDMPTDVQTEIIAEIEKEIPDITGLFLPVMMDTGDFKTSGYIGLVIAGILLVLCLVVFGIALQRTLNPFAHPAIQALERFGAAQAMVGEIDMEIAAPHTELSKKFHFTRRWLVSTAGVLDAVRHRDVMWWYKQVTQHRTNGIPTGKTYAALVYDRFGKLLTLTGKEAEVDQIAQALQQNAPGAIGGYSDELNKAWQKDRAGFIAAVEARQQQAASANVNAPR